MFGPGEYVPDPTEGIVDVKDLPAPQLVAYSRNHEHTPCRRCGHLAYRHKSDQRRLHDLGNLYAGCPVDLVVSYSSHYCSKCHKYFNVDLTDLAPPGAHYTHRVMDLAVRVWWSKMACLTALPVGICGAITVSLCPLPRSRTG